jgi:putative aminopeptidase FrvX
MNEFLKQIVNAYGPSGREEKVRQMIETEIKPLNLEAKTDVMGNLIVHRPPAAASGKAAKIMFCAHLDEIGVIVTHIDKKGFLRFTNIGGIYSDRVLFQRVMFENGQIGVIGVETKPQTPKPPVLDNYYIDIGCRDADDARARVRIGDIATYHQQAQLIQNRFAAKALDDRIGCYCLVEVLKRLKSNSADLYFVFSVQEEVGLRGARTGAFSIAPDYAIAVDVTATGDTPEAPTMEVRLGGGPAIKVKDSMFIAHPKVKDKLTEYAGNLGLPYQLEVLEHGTTDASVIQLAGAGVVSGVLSIPTRYVHSANEFCDLDDVESTIKLLAHAAERGLA